MEEIDQFSDVPRYKQLAAILTRQIESGEIEQLALLPSETTLQQQYGLSRDTVRAAISVLREAGLVFTVPQWGTYAGQRPEPK